MQKDNNKEILELFNNLDKENNNPDCNIKKYFEYNSLNIDISQQQKEEKNIYYDSNEDEYYNSFMNYYASGFINNAAGLEKSQLQTLIGILKYYNEEKYFSINGGPGSGKSTMLNYLISNILFNDFIKWDKLNENNIAGYLQKYSFPKILLCATTKSAVNNLSELCEINLPKSQKWIQLNNCTEEMNQIINDIFYHLDYSLIKYDDNSSNNDIDNQLKKLKNSIVDLKSNYVKYANNFFKSSNLKFEDIPKKIFSYISWNIKQISKFNDSLINFISNKSFIETFNKNISILENIINLSNLYNLYDLCNQDKKGMLSLIIEIYSRSKNTLESLKKINNNYHNKIDEIINEFENLKNTNNSKIKTFFTTKTKIKNTFNNIKFILDSYINSVKNEIDKTCYNINIFIREIKNIIKNFNDGEINKEEIDSINSLVELELDFNNLTSDDLIDFISSIGIAKIYFNKIQQNLDTKIRRYNSYLLLHLREWQILNSNFDDIQKIFPIISTNVQKFSLPKFNNLYYPNKFNNKINFDCIIIDEAGQTSSPYLLYLLSLSNKIIAVGDEKQLESMFGNDNKLKNNLKETELHNWLLNNGFFNNDQFISILQWVNNHTNFRSRINDKKFIGLYLLEHFRCPYQIYEMINKSFYDNNLVFKGNYNQNECAISKIISNDNHNFDCGDISFIQIKYDNPKDNKVENHINYYEIDLILNFIIDNFEDISDHIDNNYKNFAIVTLYKNQGNAISAIIKSILNIKNMDEYENNIKIDKSYIEKIKEKILNTSKQKDIINFLQTLINKNRVGNIDKLQGLGCDFVIFSNSDLKICSNKENSFEFNKKRINVLWSRTKKHFIEFIANSYWESNEDVNNYRKDIELNSLDNNINKLIININQENIDSYKLDNIINNNASSINTDCIKEKIYNIGKYGEEAFNSILNNNTLKKYLIDKLNQQLSQKIGYNCPYNWINQNGETYQPYDFEFNNNILLDVKTSIGNNYPYVNIDKNKKPVLAVINNILDFNINVVDQSALAFVLKNINFYEFKYNDLKYAHYKNNQTNDFITIIRNKNNKVY